MVSFCSKTLIFRRVSPISHVGVPPPLLPSPPRGMTFALVKVFIENKDLLRGLFTVGNLYYCHGYLTVIPRARMGSESIAHEAEGRMGY